jgi:hypothetical protein
MAIVANEMIHRFQESAKMVSSFGGVMSTSLGGINRWRQTMQGITPSLIMNGVSVDDLGAAYKALTSTYAVSKDQANKFGMSVEAYGQRSALAITRTLAMGRVVGMTTQETGALVSTFGVLGENLEDSSLLVGKMAVASERLGITMSDLTKDITTLTPANMYAGKSVEKSMAALTRFGASITSLNDPLLKSVDKNLMAANAMRAVAEGAASLDLPQMLAVGGALNGFTGNMDDALKKVMSMNRLDIAKNAFKGIEGIASPGQKNMAKLLIASSMHMGTLVDQYAIAQGNASALATQGTSQLATDREGTEKMGDMLTVAKAQVGRLDTLIQAVKALPGAIASGTTGQLFSGGGASATAFPSMPVVPATSP